MDSPLLDPIDRALLAELRFDARISWRELGERVGLGSTATADRVRRLVDIGVITRFTTVVDPASVGIGLRAIVDIRLAANTDSDDFEAMLATHTEVQQAFHVTGPFDYQLMLSCADVATLDQLLRGWKRSAGVMESNTRILMTEIDLSSTKPPDTGARSRHVVQRRDASRSH